MLKKSSLAVLAALLLITAGCADLGSSATPSTSTTQQSPSSRLTVYSSANTTLNVTLVLSERTDGDEAYNQTHRFARRDMIRLDDHFEPDVAYWFIIRIDDTEVFDYLIAPNMGVEVRIRSPTTVEVTHLDEI